MKAFDVYKLIAKLEKKGVKTVTVKLTKDCKGWDADYLKVAWTPKRPEHKVQIRDLKDWDMTIGIKQGKLEVLQ